MNLWSWMKPEPEAAASEPIATGPPAESPAEPMQAETVWSRIETIVSGAARSMAATLDMQKSAAMQLDAAAYDLSRLMSELSAVVDVPKPVKVAVVHKLERKQRVEPGVRRKKVAAA